MLRENIQKSIEEQYHGYTPKRLTRAISKVCQLGGDQVSPEMQIRWLEAQSIHTALIDIDDHIKQWVEDKEYKHILI